MLIKLLKILPINSFATLPVAADNEKLLNNNAREYFVETEKLSLRARKELNKSGSSSKKSTFPAF